MCSVDVQEARASESFDVLQELITLKEVQFLSSGPGLTPSRSVHSPQLSVVHNHSEALQFLQTIRH